MEDGAEVLEKEVGALEETGTTETEVSTGETAGAGVMDSTGETTGAGDVASTEVS